MKDIEKLLEKARKQDINIPLKIEHRIQYTLKNKNKNNWRYSMKKVVTALVATIIVFIGSISVYATFGGTIEGKPIIEWLGIKFSDKYEDYKIEVEGQEIINGETKIDLASVVCDEGFTILEFDINVSKEDKEYLGLGENMITEEFLEQVKEESRDTDLYKNMLKNKDILKNTLGVDFNSELIGPDDKLYNILVDDKLCRVKKAQNTTKISDYKYKVYQLYFLTEKELGNKTDFKLTLKNNKLKNIPNGVGVFPYNSLKSIQLDGEINVNVSKKKSLENTKINKDINQKVEYKKMVQKIDRVTETPLQTIIKVTSTINDLSFYSLTHEQDENYIGIQNFKVYDNNGNEIESCTYETERKVTYENGKVEEWATGDIGTNIDFDNAKMELTQYIILEKKENINNLKIVPTVEKINKENTKEKIEIGEFNIDLKN